MRPVLLPLALSALTFACATTPIPREPARPIASSVARPPTPAPATASAAASPATKAKPGRATAGVESEGEAILRPCPAESPELASAHASLDALRERIGALAPKDDVKEVAAAFAALVAGPCFALIRNDFPGADAFTSSASLRAFWTSGGDGWVSQALGFSDDERPIVHTIPTPRKALSLDATPKHPLAPLMLCAEADARCGAETAGWARRASHTFTAFDRVRALEHATTPLRDQSECTKAATALPPLERFDAFRACMAATETPRTTLPLGAFKAPREGWLVVRGRRGHYSFCDEIRAYDLATGAAYIVRSCGGLALQNDGSVDGRKTRASQAPRDDAGRVSLDAIREAAFVIALMGEVDHRVVPSAFGWYVPSEIPLARKDTFSGGMLFGSYSSSSAQTSLAFSWRARGTVVQSGTLTWPEDYNDAARAHAVDLLAIAETTFVSGCAPAAPPADLLATSTHGRVSGIDADASTVDATQRGLSEALTRLVKARTCTAR